MKIAYFDCTSGISGDMVLGAMLGCGLRVSELEHELAGLKIGRFSLRPTLVKRGHIKGIKVNIKTSGSHLKVKNPEGISRLLDASRIHPKDRKAAKAVFLKLARAEAAVHRCRLSKVHFHQLGEIDTIIDIVGCVAGLRLLEVEKVFASPVTIGSGTIKSAEEVFPLPAPAALHLLKQRIIRYEPRVEHELVTPTGAAIIAALTEEAGQPPLSFKVEKTGYGAGTHTNPFLSNLLQITIGTGIEKKYLDRIVQIETNIDDMPGSMFEVVLEKLMAAGALDVCMIPIIMKKSRPGVLLQVQAVPESLDRLIDIIFSETTTLGVRVQKLFRRKLTRKILNLKTQYGIIVKVKIGYKEKEAVNLSPEYSDCRRISEKTGIPFKKVYAQVMAEAVEKLNG